MLAISMKSCLQCGGCVPLCPAEALFLSFDLLVCDPALCSACGICIRFCPVGAIKESDVVHV